MLTGVKPTLLCSLAVPSALRCNRTRWEPSALLVVAVLVVAVLIASCSSGGSGSETASTEPSPSSSTNPSDTSTGQGTQSSANPAVTPSSVTPGSVSPVSPTPVSPTPSATTPVGPPSPSTTVGSDTTPSSPASSNSNVSTEDDTSAATSEDPTTTSTDSSSPDSSDITGPPVTDFYPCDAADPADYDVVATQTGETWSVKKGAQEIYSGTTFEQVLTAAYGALTQNRTTKESILVLGNGSISASSQLRMPSYLILNVCGTVDVTGTPSGSDRSPFYARGANQIDIPNLKLTGSPQYGLFFRETNDVHLGQVDLHLTRDAGIGIRIDSGGDAGSSTDFNHGLTIDYVYGTGMGSHIVETYGIDQIEIGAVEGDDVGECGLLLNRSTNAEVGSVNCTDCGTGTGYAAFRVANSVGKIGTDFPAGNIHVGKVTARGGGRGIFSVSGCGGLVIDELDIADTGNTSILMQNTYNTVIAAKSGVVSGGLVQLTNDTDNTNGGVYPPSKDVTLQNLTLTNGASVRQDWCDEFGSNGCTAMNITGGNVSMCQ